jgi:ribosomal protein S18 acetylase RimI-like enzyme
MGYGKKALKMAVSLLEKERKYEAIEICVKKDATQAISVYEDIGFFDTGYIDPDTPDSYCLRYDFK